MPVSDKVRGFMEQGGWIRRMFEAGITLKAQHGDENVFDLSLGNPVVEPPAEFREELRRLTGFRVAVVGHVAVHALDGVLGQAA